MEIEPKKQSRNFRSEKFVCSDFLAEWKTAFSQIKSHQQISIYFYWFYGQKCILQSLHN